MGPKLSSSPQSSRWSLFLWTACCKCIIFPCWEDYSKAQEQPSSYCTCTHSSPASRKKVIVAQLYAFLNHAPNTSFDAFIWSEPFYWRKRMASNSTISARCYSLEKWQKCSGGFVKFGCVSVQYICLWPDKTTLFSGPINSVTAPEMPQHGTVLKFIFLSRSLSIHLKMF